MPIQAPKWGFRGLWTPKCDYSSSRPPKDTSLRKFASFKLSTVKIRWGVWPVGELTESVTDTQTHTHRQTHTQVNLYSVHALHSIRQTIMQARAIVTMEGEYETVHKLLNGAISNDIEWSLSEISRSRYYSTLNNSKHRVQNTYSGGQTKQDAVRKACLLKFSVAGPDIWNSLPATIRTID